TVAAELEALEERQIGHVDAGPTDDRARLRSGVDVRDADRCVVESRAALFEPGADISLRVAGDDRARALSPRTADALAGIDVRDAEAEFGRLARLELRHAGDLPAVDHTSGQPVTRLDLRQIIQVVDGDYVRAVEVEQSVIVAA